MRLPALALSAAAWGAAALMAGCAGAPRIETSSTGPGPDKAATYRFVAPAGDAAPVIQPQVEARLTALGYRKVEDDPRYVVEIAVAARPLNVGAYIKTPDNWLEHPPRRASKTAGLCQVGLRFVDAHTGAESYRVIALQRRTKDGCPVQDGPLTDAALKDVPLPPPPAKP